jgi:hypothetical protein
MPPIPFKGLLTGSDGQGSESARIEPTLRDSLASHFPGERKRAQVRILKIAETEPKELVPILLRHADDENEKVSESVRYLLGEIAKNDSGKEAIIDNASNLNRDVRVGVKKAVQDIWGAQAVLYPSLYDEIIMVMEAARDKEVPVDDIGLLASLTKRTFLDGEMFRSVADLSQCLELAKFRFRNAETLKTYLTDMLRTIPELDRMGASTNSMEGSLRTALIVSRSRQFDYTKGLIEDRKREQEIRDELVSMGEAVKEFVPTRPQLQMAELNEMDARALERIRGIVQMANSPDRTDTRSSELGLLHDFLVSEFSADHENSARTRIEVQDPSALFTMYVIGIVSLKLVSDLFPVTAEEIYQRFYRALEGDPTLIRVKWPEAVLRGAE